MGLVLGACGGDDGGGDGDGNAGGTQPNEEDLTPTPGGSITYGLEADTTGGWCLAEAQLAISGIQVARAIYDTLTAPDADGNIKPHLAESFESNADATEWTFKLRSGVKFHDGTDLTAQVVKDNIDAWRGALPERSPLLFTFVFPDIDTVEVVDPLTVKVTTKRPWPALPWFFWSSGRLGIMGEAQLKDPENCNTNMIGTGPFTKDSWITNERFVAKKNPNYWRSDANGVPLPYLDEIVFIPSPNSPERLTAVQAGDLTMAHMSGALQITELREDVDAGRLSSVESEQWAEVGYAMLNATKAPFNNRAARLAAAHAINRDQYNELRNNGILTNASGPFAPGAPGYLEDAGYPEYDPDKAREYVAQYEEESG
jgi:peptide/nickel transport system substrate-binding protein